MFKINLEEKRDVFNHLLNINENLIFVEGSVCSMHKGAVGFAEVSLPVTIASPLICKCLSVKELLRSRTLQLADFYPEEAKIEITEPYEFTPEIPIIQGEDYLLEWAEKRYHVLQDIFEVEEGSLVADPRGEEHEVAILNINNDVFKDMLMLTGTSDKVEITTGKKLKVKNWRNGAEAKEPSIRNSSEVSCIITEAARSILDSSLIKMEDNPGSDDKEESKNFSTVYLVDKSFLVVKNSCSTIISSRVEKR